MTAPAPGNDDLTAEELDELDMELHLALFERDAAIACVIDGVPAELRESHRVCFRAGWKAARAAERENE